MTLIYFSPTPWDSFSQRPHAFVTWYHEKYVEPVIWIDPYPARLPRLDDVRRVLVRSTKIAGTGEPRPTWLKVIRPGGLPLEPLPVARQLNELIWNRLVSELRGLSSPSRIAIGIGKPSRLAYRCLKQIPHAISFMDVMDNVKAMFTGISSRSIQSVERRTVQIVDRVLTSSSSLYREFCQYHPDVVCVGNGFDEDILPSRSRDNGIGGKPLIGYVGTVAKWFDWTLILEIAELRPDLAMHIIGPLVTVPPTLPENVALLPALPHAKAMKAMGSFDLGVIPFKLDELTEAVDPVKYYEYRALGIPVLSTPFGEMRNKKDDGLFLTGAKPLDHIISSALSFVESDGDHNDFRRSNSWRARFDAIPPLGRRA